LSHGLQFLASYTFSKTLDSDGSDVDAVSSGNARPLGDQNSVQRWGRASFDRTHRFVFSTIWDLPSPAGGIPFVIFGGWSAAAVTTIQSGNALTIANTNAANVFGITQDRAQLSGTCTKSQLITAGSTRSNLDGYFDKACFADPRVIGADGIGTDFGNSGTGLVDGPGQANLDLALSKAMTMNWLKKNSRLRFRAEFYNALNRTQFSNPDSNRSSPTFGFVTSTSVNARVGQLALKYEF
jgi:hypothetical protein